MVGLKVFCPVINPTVVWLVTPVSLSLSDIQYGAYGQGVQRQTEEGGAEGHGEEDQRGHGNRQFSQCTGYLQLSES